MSTCRNINAKPEFYIKVIKVNKELTVIHWHLNATSLIVFLGNIADIFVYFRIPMR